MIRQNLFSLDFICCWWGHFNLQYVIINHDTEVIFYNVNYFLTIFSRLESPSVCNHVFLILLTASVFRPVAHYSLKWKKCFNKCINKHHRKYFGIRYCKYNCKCCKYCKYSLKTFIVSLLRHVYVEQIFLV